MNMELVKDSIASQPLAKEIFYEFVNRKRFSRLTNLTTLKSSLELKGITVDDKEYIGFFKVLENSGAGRILIGREGTPSFFDWDYSLRDVAKSAIKGSESPVKPVPQLRKYPGSTAYKRAPSSNVAPEKTKIEIIVPNTLMRLLKKLIEEQ